MQKTCVSTLLGFMLMVVFWAQEANGQGIENSPPQVILRVANVWEKPEPKDPWVSRDKIQHFFASAFLTSFGFFIMREPLNSSENNSLYFGSGVSLSFGVGKEIYDWKSKRGHASYKDLVADILGIGFAILIFKVT